jgi:hypothetical protein
LLFLDQHFQRLVNKLFMIVDKFTKFGILFQLCLKKVFFSVWILLHYPLSHDLINGVLRLVRICIFTLTKGCLALVIFIIFNISFRSLSIQSGRPHYLLTIPVILLIFSDFLKLAHKEEEKIKLFRFNSFL